MSTQSVSLESSRPPLSMEGIVEAHSGQAERDGGRPRPAGPADDRSLVVAGLVELAEALPSRIEIDPEAVSKDLARLVLTLVELLRRIVEHQAIRRMDDPELSAEQVERMGVALLRLEEKMAEMKAVFGLAGEELNIDLGPLGRLL